MTLADIIKPITGNKRTFLLMRIAGLDADLSMKLTGVTRGTYNSWFKNEEFAAVHTKLPELIQEHRLAAIQLLRKDNQLEAILLEGKIIQKIKEEIESGHYDFVRTNLAREAYSKLLSDFEKAPGVQVLSWQQRVSQFFPKSPEQIEEGEVIDVEFEEIGIEQTKHSQSKPTSEGEQVPDEDKETAKS